MTPHAAPEARGREVRRVLHVMLALNLFLVAAKALAGFRADSLAVVGSAVDSGVDSVATLVALALAGIASQGPDERHPYGHAKFDTLGALVIVAFLSVTVFELVQGAVGRLRDPRPPGLDARLAVSVMVGSLVIGWLASAWERRRGEALGSVLLTADATQLRADVYVNVAVLAGLGLRQAGLERADAWTTLLVAALIVRTGWGIVREAVPVLVDERGIDPLAVRRVAEAADGVHSAYDVRSRGRPGHVFAELTISVGAEMDVEAAHRIADEVERALIVRLGVRDVVVHVEPVSRGRGEGGMIPPFANGVEGE